MGEFFYNLGKKAGPGIRKARWIWQSIAGSEADAIELEHQVGNDLASEVRSKVKPYRQQEIEKMLSETGNRLAGCVADKSRTFSFEAFADAEPNAFALPGGFIFVSSSILELCEQNQDEIAFILGHEMAHVIRGHAMDRIIRNSAITTASRAVPVRGLLAGWLRNVGVQFLESAYSREMESEADRLAVHLVAAADYDPRAGLQLLRRLEKLRSDIGQSELGRYFSSHPPFKVRIDDVKCILQRLKI